MLGLGASVLSASHVTMFDFMLSHLFVSEAHTAPLILFLSFSLCAVLPRGLKLETRRKDAGLNEWLNFCCKVGILCAKMLCKKWVAQ
jgi:hypothetical protein